MSRAGDFRKQPAAGLHLHELHGRGLRDHVRGGNEPVQLAPEQEKWVRSDPVFYLRKPTGTPSLRYPADLYRANYLGAAMFLDEPASIMTWDKSHCRRAGAFLRRSGTHRGADASDL